MRLQFDATPEELRVFLTETTEMLEQQLNEECSAAWGGARTATQNVAFRVIEVVDDVNGGRVPIWGPCPLTEEEEAILRGLTQMN